MFKRDWQEENVAQKYVPIQKLTSEKGCWKINNKIQVCDNIDLFSRKINVTSGYAL